MYQGKILGQNMLRLSVATIVTLGMSACSDNDNDGVVSDTTGKYGNIEASVYVSDTLAYFKASESFGHWPTTQVMVAMDSKLKRAERL